MLKKKKKKKNAVTHDRITLTHVKRAASFIVCMLFFFYYSNFIWGRGGSGIYIHYLWRPGEVTSIYQKVQSMFKLGMNTPQ